MNIEFESRPSHAESLTCLDEATALDKAEQKKRSTCKLGKARTPNTTSRAAESSNASKLASNASKASKASLQVTRAKQACHTIHDDTPNPGHSAHCHWETAVWATEICTWSRSVVIRDRHIIHH